MLPTSNPRVSSKSSQRRGYYSTYFRRLLKPKQMDLEYTTWVMLQLCINPKAVYRHTAYHKQTKNQWARDDPAFVVACCLLVFFASTAYCVTFGDSFMHSLTTIASAVIVDFLLLGSAVATATWLISNKFLRKRTLHHQVEQHVEWLYAFDVHCNSFFPLFLCLYVLQFILSPLLLWNSVLSSALSMALYATAFGYYHYMTFLGFSSLPFLEHTEVFLWPIGIILILVPFSVLAGLNPTAFTLGIYFSGIQAAASTSATTASATLAKTAAVLANNSTRLSL